MRKTVKGNETTFSYKGDLTKEITKLEKERKNLLSEITFYRWQLEKAKKEHFVRTRRIDDINTFIKLSLCNQMNGETNENNTNG